MTARNGFYAAGFWGPRGEDLDSAARRLKQFLDQLGTIHPLLAEWYFGVTHKGANRVTIPISEPGLREWIAVEAKGMRESLPDNIADRFGAMVGAWAGDYEVSASLNARFGFLSERVGNAAVLKLPQALAPVLADVAKSRSLIDAIVSSWDPDRAVLRPDDVLRDDAVPAKPGEIVRAERFWRRFPDWIVYKRGEQLELGGPFKGKAH